MNPTIARLTARTLLGRRRAALLLVLPVTLLATAAIVRAAAGVDTAIGVHVLGVLALGTLVPLLGLICGTGAIGPEIDDGSIIYLLAKPQSRMVIATTKFLVAAATMLVFAALPTLVAGLILLGGRGNLAVGYAAASLVAGLAYSALYLALAVASRNAVVIGLGYALVWESLIGTFVPGAQVLSVQQWARAVAKIVSGSPEVTSAVGLTTAVVALLVVTAGATWFAGHRLRSLRLTTES